MENPKRTTIENNIKLDRVSKKFYVTFYYGKDTAGKNIRKSKSFADLDEARIALSKHDLDMKQGLAVQPSKVTLTKAIANHLDLLALKSEASTIYGYRTIEKHVNSHPIGKKSIQNIKPTDVQEYLLYMQTDKGVSSNTALKHYNFLNSVFNLLEQQEAVARNPVKRVVAPKKVKHQADFLTVDEAKQILERVKGDINNQILARKLIELHEMYPVYGLDSLYHIVRKQVPCSRGRVHRLMKQYGIHSIRYKSNAKHRYFKHFLPVKDDLLEQNFNVTVPNSVWVGDITYIKTLEGWLYLAIVKDLCTRQIVGYAMSERIDTNLTIAAIDMAVRRTRFKGNLTFRSDRGSQYASFNYQEKVKALGIKSSMSRSGNPYDNAVAESFFSSLKCELVHLKTFYTKEHAELEIFHYIEKYNNIRPHSSIGWIPTNEFAKKVQTISA